MYNKYTMESPLVKLYHTVFILLPVFMIFILISIVYSGYVLTYCLVLINAESYPADQFPLRFTSDQSTSYTKGVTLLTITLISLVFLFIALLRTILTDPGYFPSPLDLEKKILTKHSHFPEKKISDANVKLNNLLFSEDSEKPEGFPLTASDVRRLNLEPETSYLINRFYFLNTFSDMISEHPLTFLENEELRDKVNRYLKEYKELKQEIDSEKKELVTKDETCIVIKETNTKADIFNTFLNTELSKAMLCGTCLRWKIERSHHCRQCGKCVLKMDHHCPWLANCIGFRNYKFFLLTHLYGLIGSSIIGLTHWEALINANMSEDSNLLGIWWIFFVYLTNLGLFGFLLWLFLVNWKLVLNGQTVIENADRERFPSTKAINIYDVGAYNNFCNVFGENAIVWFIPFFPNYRGSGLVFDTIYNRQRA